MPIGGVTLKNVDDLIFVITKVIDDVPCTVCKGSSTVFGGRQTIVSIGMVIF